MLVNIVYLGLNNFHFLFCFDISRLQIQKVVKNEINGFMSVSYFKLFISYLNQCFQI